MPTQFCFVIWEIVGITCGASTPCWCFCYDRESQTKGENKVCVHKHLTFAVAVMCEGNLRDWEEEISQQSQITKVLISRRRQKWHKQTHITEFSTSSNRREEVVNEEGEDAFIITYPWWIYAVVRRELFSFMQASKPQTKKKIFARMITIVMTMMITANEEQTMTQKRGKGPSHSAAQKVWLGSDRKCTIKMYYTRKSAWWKFEIKLKGRRRSWPFPSSARHCVEYAWPRKEGGEKIHWEAKEKEARNGKYVERLFRKSDLNSGEARWWTEERRKKKSFQAKAGTKRNPLAWREAETKSY